MRTYSVAITVTTNDPKRATKLRKLFKRTGGEIEAPDPFVVLTWTDESGFSQVLMERKAEG